MTVIMTSKNQITLPKKLTGILGLEQGTMFEVTVHKNKIELTPLETQEMKFSDQVYKKLDALSLSEKGKEKKITKRFIDDLKKGKV